MPDPIEEAVNAPVVDGVPLKGVCGSEEGWLRTGGAETEADEAEVWRAITIPFGIAEAKGTEPSTLNSGRMFHIMIRECLSVPSQSWYLPFGLYDSALEEKGAKVGKSGENGHRKKYI
jgi:hypothetical protein